MTDVPFAVYGIEVNNVKNPVWAGVGAKGDGSTDDSAAIQAAINDAFGTAAAPHGVNSHLNKVLYFPHGNYLVTTPLLFTNVQGAVITGDGQCSRITGSGAISTIVTNGMRNCRFEHLTFVCNGGSTKAAVDLDWNGSTSGAMAGAGLQDNVFQYFTTGGSTGFGIRIANSGFGGSGNRFDACYLDTSSTAALATMAASATGNQITEANIGGSRKGIWISNGSVTWIAGCGFQNRTDGTMWDLWIDNCTDTVTIQATRSESTNGLHLFGTNVTKCDGYCMALGTITTAIEIANGKVILDGCSAASGVVSGSTGTLYRRGCNFPSVTFSGTIGQNI